MSNKLEIHVGESLQDSKRRVLNAVARAKRGETVVENHLTFENWETLSKVMTGKRYELLQQLHRRPASSIRDLSRALGRDYKRVHQDVTALTSAGLIAHDDMGFRADYDFLQATIPL